MAGEMPRETDVPALLSAVAHDLRTPLSTIYGFARTIERQAQLDARSSRFLTLILDAAADMERDLDHLAVIGRVLSGRFVARREPVSTGDVASEAMAALPPRPDARAVALGERHDGGRVVETDRAAAARAVALLADAALRLDAELPAASVAALDGGVVIRPFSADVRPIVLEGGRDLPLATAHSLLRALGAQLEPVGEDALRVGFP
jgi:signal transduction histidine kinase